MKPLKLIMSAFGPFAEMTEIDFTKIGKCGVYLITGDTGSGKTTIMAWLLSNVPNNRRLITIEEGYYHADYGRSVSGGCIHQAVRGPFQKNNGNH